MITSLENLKADIEGPCGEVARVDAVRQVVMMRAILRREMEVRRKTDESAAKDEENHLLQQELEHEQVGYHVECLCCTCIIILLYIMQAERARTEEHLITQLRQRDTEIHQQMVQLEEKDAQIHQKEAELRQARIQLNSTQLNLEVLT